MKPTLITAKNGKARPKNPYSQSNPDEYIQAQWDQFESTVQCHDCPEATEDREYWGELQHEYLREDFDYAVWYKYDPLYSTIKHHKTRQVWRIVPQPQENGLDLNKLEKEVDAFISKQTTESYNKMFDEMDREKEEAKTVEGDSIERILKSFIVNDFLREKFNLDFEIGFTTKQVAEAMQAYSSQQNTTLMEALQYVKKVIENSEHWWMDCPDKGGFNLDIIDEALKPKQ